MKGFIVQVGDVDVLQTYPPPREGVRVAGQGRVLLSLSGTPLNIPDLLSSAEIPGPESCTGPPPRQATGRRRRSRMKSRCGKLFGLVLLCFAFFCVPVPLLAHCT